MTDRSIAHALSRVLDDPATPRRPLDVHAPHRYAILSDQHKGARDKADAFRQCESAYTAALTHYRDRGFTLILLGDVEELWEQGFAEVAQHYGALLELEGSFGARRYIRIFGNHDDDRMDAGRVAAELAHHVPVPAVHEGLRFDVTRGDAVLGTVLLVHGHQGTFFSHRARGMSRFFMRLWRPLQRAFGLQIRTPSTDPCLRAAHDRAMYAWAVAQQKVVLIAGHTHRPVWSSRTHLQKLEAEREALLAEPDPPPPRTGRRLEDLDGWIARRRREHPPCDDTVKTRPVYFNTGCCIFDDGDITGMEIEDGVLRLVKWPAGGTEPKAVLEEERLEAVLSRAP
jgi:predicted phosphodiesterase